MTAPAVVPGWLQACRALQQASQDVSFADVEEALRDRDRLDWLMPLIGTANGATDVEITRRSISLAIGLSGGLKGRALVDFARTRCES